MTPYNEEEYKKLWKDIRRRLPSCSTNGHGKSLLSLHKGRYHELGSALEGCVHVDEDYKTLLLFIEKGRFAYGGYRHNPSCTYTDVEADPLYMNFLAKTKLDGALYVFKVNDLNGLPVFINSNGTVDHDKNLVNQEMGDDDNLILHVVAGANDRTTMVKDPIQEAMTSIQANEDFVD
ncbi:hypothetical protein H5410_023242 [Solanum commersonii]|uniref:Uncharacterized protein n=1 Tax=Solanum commersonii TaxID=4109 RepID=A0A9J5ZGA5_SOLCO|nr:hypothetical protein H5410_023242 [Solanum commersonii]